MLSFLYIELALVCCTNPNNVHCFWTMFSNLKFVFASICAAHLVPMQSDQYRSCSITVIVKWCRRWEPLGSSRWPGQQQNQRCGSKFVKLHDFYTPEECVDEWRQNNADLKLLCHECFHHVQHHVHDSHCIGEFTTVIWCLDSFTVLFRSYDCGESGLRELASVNWRTKCAKLIKYGHVADLQKLLCQPGSKNGLIYMILRSSFCSYLELWRVSLIDDAQNMQNELIYHFLQLIKIKDKLCFAEISHDFYVFAFLFNLYLLPTQVRIIDVWR